MAPTLGKDQCVEIPQKGGKFELDVSSNSSFCVKLEGNPTTGYSWSLDNENELEKFGIEKVSQEYVSKKHPKGMVGVGGNYTFNFNVKDTCGKELPSLQFVYKRSWEKNNGTTASVKLNSIEKCGSNPNDDVNAPTLDISQEGGNFKLDVNDNSSFNIKIAGNPTTGYSWYLENAEELHSSDVILPTNLDEGNGSQDYISDPNGKNLDGVGGTFVFKFEVKNACGKELPKLNFGYKRPWETTGSVATAEVTLTINGCSQNAVVSGEDEPTVNISQEGGKFNLDVNDNTSFIVKLAGNPTTGYSWYLENAEELKSSDVLLPTNLNERNGSDDYVAVPHEEGMVGYGGTFIYKFNVKDACGKELPKLNFGYKRPWETTGSIATAEVTLSVHGCEQEQEEIVDKEIVLSRSATEGVILLSNGMTFSIKLNGNPTTGYSWYLTNEEELLNHGITPLNLTPEKSGEYTSTAPKGLVGGGGIFDFKFKIKEVTNDIPTIKFTYRRSWMPVSESDRILEVEIKPE